MARSTQERRDIVLRAIVADYVHSGEPVGSKALVDKHHLDVSPATVRNDMSALEDEGYIYQPHTSAGRVPTEKGYRAFVDQIARLKPLSAPERAAIESFLANAVDIDDLIDRTVRLLAQLTHQVALVQYPTYQRSGVRHLELVPLNPTRLLVVIITNSGKVEQRTLEVSEPLTDADVTNLSVAINSAVTGVAPAHLAGLSFAHLTMGQAQRRVADDVVRLVTEVLTDDADTRIVMAGTANLVRAGHYFSTPIGPVLDALEEQVALLRLFAEATEGATEGVSVTIGTETQHTALTETALVAGTYGSDGEGQSHLGVIGPTRMDYPTAMTTVGAVARYLSHFLSR
ncbi:heat-inducible transcriptional repressor HrcA [Nanchangia anserum]|uniref:Heat-inducible transcription repressor HrcA n=1 Tax=Nanchangia anserum TaxID=2692125 RepID=A0A8I0KVM4_9ACTO|nr:heat-inducible transcriptional repressor HrcA [Nanchangia anserum]MBD3689094.1 heat-inducible transcriptional repressor HrcA [Nanchangia anserum]QOX81332.1 heat-inducible transcriptional repressor HrcA [Nanchangia anserum]